MTSRAIGLVVFWAGAFCMVGVGWVLSWWYVPAIREVGFGNIPFPKALSIFWGMSAPVGSILVAVGAFLYAQVDRRRLVSLIVGGLILSAWLAIWSVSQPLPVLFGIGGGLIVLFFLGVLWHWARIRITLPKSEQSASDLQMVGHIFYLIAAWYLCGVLGAPMFALRPALMERFATLPGAVTLASQILVCLVLGWAFTFSGYWLALRAKTENT